MKAARQLRHVIGVSIASPAPTRLMMTISSDVCSTASVGSPPTRGSRSGTPSAPIPTPAMM